MLYGILLNHPYIKSFLKAVAAFFILARCAKAHDVHFGDSHLRDHTPWSYLHVVRHERGKARESFSSTDQEHVKSGVSDNHSL